MRGCSSLSLSSRPAEGAAPGPVVVVLPVFSELLLLILIMAGSCLLHDDGETEPDHVSAVKKTMRHNFTTKCGFWIWLIPRHVYWAIPFDINSSRFTIQDLNKINVKVIPDLDDFQKIYGLDLYTIYEKCTVEIVELNTSWNW